MTPTLFSALLLHPNRGRHLSLHTTRKGADLALDAAVTAEWDQALAYGLGPAAQWQPEQRRRVMEERGYIASVEELPVHFSEEEDAEEAEHIADRERSARAAGLELS